MLQKSSQLNCMTLSRWRRHEIVSVTFTRSMPKLLLTYFDCTKLHNIKFYFSGALSKPLSHFISDLALETQRLHHVGSSFELCRTRYYSSCACLVSGFALDAQAQALLHPQITWCNNYHTLSFGFTYDTLALASHPLLWLCPRNIHESHHAQIITCAPWLWLCPRYLGISYPWLSMQWLLLLWLWIRHVMYQFITLLARGFALDTRALCTLAHESHHPRLSYTYTEIPFRWQPAHPP